MLIGAAAIAVVAAIPLGVVAQLGKLDPGLPGLDSAKSFLAMMTERSPGERTEAELTKTKKRAAVAAPTQRALAKVVKPDLPTQVGGVAPPLPDKAETPAQMAAIGPMLLTPTVPGGGGGIFVPSPPGGGGGPPGGPPGTENPPPENPPPENPPPENPPPENPPPPPETPTVPEPGTWATMLLGFGLTGVMIRRRRRTQSAAASA